MKKKNYVANFATNIVALAAFMFRASDILQRPHDQTVSCCLPRKGSLTLDYNGLIGLEQKVTKHYTCLVGTKA